ncbi:hypothetical protein BwiPL1_20740 [Bacillus wiedmannii]|nr:hypothetical protein BwiPL1_20740 [Bacillus wiedmannii]
MSISVCVYCREGIILASDSRLTLTNSQVENSVMYSDNTTKTFLAKQIGISFTGDSDIEGVHISKFINNFIDENITVDTCVSTVPQLLINYFNKLKTSLQITFFVAGYLKTTKEQVLYTIYLKTGEIAQTDTKGGGASWHGDPSDILNKLLIPVYQQQVVNGKLSYTRLADHLIPFDHFNMQDSIDFAVHCVSTVEKTIRFQTRQQSVGGPIDVLVIKPGEAFWVYKKELHIK